MSQIEHILGKLERVKQASDGHIASCPVLSHGKGNGDRHPSLAIDEGEDGRVLLSCTAGCDTRDVVSALGLRMSDLFEHKEGGGNHPPGNGSRTRAPTSKPPGNTGKTTARTTPRTGFADSRGSRGQSTPNLTLVRPFVPNLTLEELADAKHLPLDFLHSMGCSDVTYQGGKAVRMVYPNPDGTAGPVRYRVAMEKPPQGGDRFRWKSGAKVQLLGLDRLDGAREAGHVVMVEGETCYFTLAHSGIPAVAVAGATNYRDDRDAKHLDGIATIYAVVEPDGGGEAFRKKLGESSIRDRVKFIDLSCFGAKDASDLWCADPETFGERFEQAKANATPWTDLESQEREEEAAAAYEIAAELLHSSNILDQVRAAIRRLGYAGDLQPPMMAYIAITSRLLSRPLNMAFIAPSAAGKNHGVDTARRLIPESAVCEYKASSDRAMIYDDRLFTNRVVLFSEADSIPEDGPAASAVRSLASDQVMSYDVVERDETTGKWQTRHIAKPGPTSLMTTSTKSLAHQFDTRLLEVSISDSEDQTRAVLAAHALMAMPSSAEEIDVSTFHALQEWIELAGCHDVAVPFGNVLATLVPAKAVRMRRDFRQLLTFIQSIAMLHQCQRGRTPEGWIIATTEDYAAAHELLEATFDTVTSEGVTPAIRDVVEAIGDREEISVAKLADRMQLASSTLRYRIGRALKGGWLVNNELARGKPYRLARGTPLPDVSHALPTVEELIATARVRESAKTVRAPTRGVKNPETTGKSSEPRESANESGEDGVPPPPSANGKAADVPERRVKA